MTSRTRSGGLLLLDDTPIDVVGDVHGHIDPLRRLLAALGYDRRGRHPDGRRAVFVGDLGDRGPDSPAVFELVMEWVEEGYAECLLGNHELALIEPRESGRRRPGNAWFLGARADCERDCAHFGPFTMASAAQRERILRFIESLPIVIEHPQAQIVHACWDPASVEFVRSSTAAINSERLAASAARVQDCLQRAGLAQRYRPAKSMLEPRRLAAEWNPAAPSSEDERALIADVTAGEAIEQREDPLRVLTSGFERAAAAPRWLGGKWRFLERVRWWIEHPPARPTLFGHYWRPRRHVAGHWSPFDGTLPHQWLGRHAHAMCLDFWWPDDPRRSGLAAYRIGMDELVFWDGGREQAGRERTLAGRR